MYQEYSNIIVKSECKSKVLGINEIEQYKTTLMYDHILWYHGIFFHFTILAPQVCYQFGYNQSEFKDFLTPGITSEESEDRKLSDSANRKQNQQSREQSKQRNIVQMLKELRTASESNVSGCNRDSDSSSDEK